MRENTIQDIVERVKSTLDSPRYRNNLTNPKVNWIEISIEDAIDTVLNYISNLEEITV